jgi:hypothetical protein
MREIEIETIHALTTTPGETIRTANRGADPP